MLAIGLCYFLSGFNQVISLFNLDSILKTTIVILRCFSCGFIWLFSLCTPFLIGHMVKNYDKYNLCLVLKNNKNKLNYFYFIFTVLFCGFFTFYGVKNIILVNVTDVLFKNLNYLETASIYSVISMAIAGLLTTVISLVE